MKKRHVLCNVYRTQPYVRIQEFGKHQREIKPDNNDVRRHSRHL